MGRCYSLLFIITYVFKSFTFCNKLNVKCNQYLFLFLFILSFVFGSLFKNKINISFVLYYILFFSFFISLRFLFSFFYFIFILFRFCKILWVANKTIFFIYIYFHIFLHVLGCHALHHFMH